MAYAPQNSEASTVRDAFWLDLETELMRAPPRSTPLLLLDSNGHPGQFPRALGRPLQGEQANANGLALVELAQRCGCALTSTMLAVPEPCTCRNPAGIFTRIDFILAPKDLSPTALDVNWKLPAQIGLRLDHAPVVMKIDIPVHWRLDPTPQRRSQRWDRECMRGLTDAGEDASKAYRTRLEQGVACLEERMRDERMSGVQLWDEGKRMLAALAPTSFHRAPGREKKKWIGEDTWEVIERRWDLVRSMNSTASLWRLNSGLPSMMRERAVSLERNPPKEKRHTTRLKLTANTIHPP